MKAASGEIIITTDDDVTFPECWLENLVSPFSRGDIAAVAGNTLPFELENKSQLLFESYGGLGKGFEQKEFSGELEQLQMLHLERKFLMILKLVISLSPWDLECLQGLAKILICFIKY